MRRGLLAIAVAVALAFPSTAGAFFSKFYTGPVGNGELYKRRGAVK